MSKQGLLVPFQSIPVDSSGLSQAGPRPGIPVPASGTTAILAATGTPVTPVAFDIKTRRGGFPGGRSGSGEEGSTFLYREDGGEWLGLDPPTSITDTQTLFPYQTDADPDLSNRQLFNPHCVALTDGTVVSICADDEGELLYCQTRDSVTGLWSVPVAFAPADTALSDAQRRHPCLVELPSGRLVCYAWQWRDVDGLLEGTATIEMWFSDDTGTTWTLGSASVLPDRVGISAAPTPTEYSLGRIRAAYGDGRVLLFAHLSMNNSTNKDDVITQHLSTDTGHTFAHIDTLPDSHTDGGAAPDVVWTGSQFLVVFLQRNYANVLPVAALIGGADPLSAAAVVQVHTTASETGVATDRIDVDHLNISVAIDDSGQAVVHFQRYASGDPARGLTSLSQDGGRTWATVGDVSSDFTKWWQDSEEYHPTEFSTCYAHGSVFMVHRGTHPVGTNATQDGRTLHCTTFGGPTNVTRPRTAGSHDPTAVLGWDDTWLPFIEPDDGAWTGTGTDPYLYTVGRDTLLRWSAATTAGAMSKDLDDANANVGMSCEFSLRVVSGGSLSVPVAILSADKVTFRHDTWVCADTTGFRLVDGVDTLSTGPTNTVDMTQRIDIRIEQVLTDVRCWYRVWNPGTPHVWIDGGSLALKDGAFSTGSHITWGRPVGGTSTSTYWWRFAIAAGADAIGYSTTETDLLGHPYTSKGTSIPGGVRLAARSGPTFTDDQWSSTPSYDYALTRATDLSVPSPRTGYRSSDLTEQQLIWDVDVFGETVGVALFESNASAIEVHGWNGSSWVELYAGARGGDFVSRPFFREGLLIKPDGASDSKYSRGNEHAGAYFSLSASVPGVRIASSTEGVWSATAGKVASRLRLVDDLTAAAEAIDSGTGELIPRDSVVLVSTDDTHYSRIRLTILAASGSGGSAAQPPEDHWQIGTAIVGRVQLHADKVGWGRTIDVEAHTETVTHRDGTTHTQVLYPPTRTASYAWVDGVDTTATSGVGNAHLSAVQFDAGVGDDGGYVGGTPWTMVGLIRELDGPHMAVVYLPVVADDRMYLHRRHELMLSRLTSPVSIETVVGDEDSDELVRVAKVTLDEVV